MPRRIRTTRQARRARRRIPDASIRYQRHAHGEARRAWDGRMRQSRADLDYLEAIMDATDREAFDAETWAPIEHHDGRRGA